MKRNSEEKKPRLVFCNTSLLGLDLIFTWVCSLAWMILSTMEDLCQKQKTDFDANVYRYLRK